VSGRGAGGTVGLATGDDSPSPGEAVLAKPSQN